MESQIFTSTSARLAEVQALDWAMQLAVERKWDKVEWISDALEVVKEIQAS